MKNHILSFFLPARGFIEKRGEREREKKASKTSDSHFTARKSASGVSAL